MNEERKGEIFVILGAFFWGLFPVITILSFTNLFPLASLAWSTLFAAVFFAVILTIKKSWKDVLNKEALRYMVWVVFFTSILYYVFTFSGLQYTSAGNASIIGLTEILFSFTLFHIWHKHYISKEHIIGACLMLVGATIVLYPNLSGFRLGDVLILAAAFVAPMGNFFQQKARKIIRSEAILFIRSICAIPFIFFIAHILKQDSTFFDLQQSIILVLVNGIILLGLSKIFWVEAIHRVSVTKANALSSVNPVITLIFAWLLLGDIPTIWQLLAPIPMIFGIILLSQRKTLSTQEVTR